MMQKVISTVTFLAASIGFLACGRAPSHNTNGLHGIANEFVNFDGKVGIIYWQKHPEGGLCFLKDTIDNGKVVATKVITEHRLPREAYAVLLGDPRYVAQHTNVASQSTLNQLLNDLLFVRGEGSTQRGEGMNQGFEGAIEGLLVRAATDYRDRQKSEPTQYPSKVLSNGCLSR